MQITGETSVDAQPESASTRAPNQRKKCGNMRGPVPFSSQPLVQAPMRLGGPFAVLSCRGLPPVHPRDASTSPPHIPTQSTNHLHLGHRRSTGGCLLVGHRYFRLRTYVRLWGWAQRGSNPGLRKSVCGASSGRLVRNRRCGRDNSIPNVRNRDEFNQIAAN